MCFPSNIFSSNTSSTSWKIGASVGDIVGLLNVIGSNGMSNVGIIIYICFQTK